MARYTVVRPVYEDTGARLYGTDAARPEQVTRLAGWMAVGPAESIEDAKSRYQPVQYGYAVTMAEGDYIPGYFVLEVKADMTPAAIWKREQLARDLREFA